MSINLPQETQTRKLKSLDSDLKKIAEELIADKFDVREEVVPEREPSFRPHPGQHVFMESTPFGPNGFFDVLNESDVGSGQSSYTRHRSDEINTRLDFYTRRRISAVAITRCSTRGIMDALQRLDMENLPCSNRVIRLGAKFWMELHRTEDFNKFLSWSDNGRGYRDSEHVGNMFGCKIFVAPGIVSEIEVSY